MVISEVPLKEAEPLKSPAREIVRAVSNALAVDAFPVTSPTRSAVTFAKVTEAEVPTACPMAIVGLVPSPGV
jgi:hypothetical protein